MAHTHPNITPKHKTHTRACALNTKTKKLKKVKDVKVEKQRKAEELWFAAFDETNCSEHS